MISHKHKCIFVHIPKTAGSSINSFFHPNVKFHFENADYERLFGWCPKRKIHMQHATSRQLLETGLITEAIWKDYFKFAFVRNPWDRAYSDYVWMKNFSKVKGSFKDYMLERGQFKGILTDHSVNSFLGDHVLHQSDFFDEEGLLTLDFVGRFENFEEDINKILGHLNIKEKFDKTLNKSKKRHKHYSHFYTGTNERLVEEKYKIDAERFNYEFEDKKRGVYKLKKLL